MTARLAALRRRPDRGSAAIEAVILTPAFFMFVLLIVCAGRLAIARQSVESAASDAARSASISRSQGQAKHAATAAATSTLTAQALECTSKRVSVDTSGFTATVGTPASVRVSVTCVVNLSDLSVPGIPGSRTITATMVSPIDTYREKTSGFTNPEAVGGTGQEATP